MPHMHSLGHSAVNSGIYENSHWKLEKVNYIYGPFYQHGLTLISAWISNHMPGEMWDEITYPSLNFNGCTVEV